MVHERLCGRDERKGTFVWGGNKTIFNNEKLGKFSEKASHETLQVLVSVTTRKSEPMPFVQSSKLKI